MATLLDHPDLWKSLLKPQHQSLIGTVRQGGDAPSPALIEGLRTSFSPDLVRAACELIAARRAGAGKIDGAAAILADVAGVQQATPSLIARHKAQRIRDAGVGDLLDLCCGIGADAVEFAAAGIRTTGYDILPARCIMAAHNAVIETRCEDVTLLDLHGRFIHLDPARRDEPTRRRLHRLAEYEPGPPFISRALAESAGASVKLGPGIDMTELSTLHHAAADCELEFITLHRTLSQAVLWSGAFAPEPVARRATKLPENLTIIGTPARPPARAHNSTPAFLLVPDPAAERAELLHVLCSHHHAAELWPNLGVLASDDNPASPWLDAFEVHADLPWREAKVRRWLRDHHAGVVEVKTRGRAVDPTPLQIRLRGDGDQPFTVLIYRLGTQLRAYCCTRMPQPTEAKTTEHQQR